MSISTPFCIIVNASGDYSAGIPETTGDKKDIYTENIPADGLFQTKNALRQMETFTQEQDQTYRTNISPLPSMATQCIALLTARKSKDYNGDKRHGSFLPRHLQTVAITETTNLQVKEVNQEGILQNCNNTINYIVSM